MTCIVSRTYAARPLRVALAVAFVALGVDMSFAAARTYFAQADAESAVSKHVCREIVVEADEGYGVRGTVTQTVCNEAQ